MREILIAILLGVIQGLGEFLPISSSGHLRLFQDAFGWTDQFGLVFDTWLHVATLGAVVVYFREDLANMATAAFSRNPERARDKRLAWLVVVATIPTGMIGLLGGDFFENASLLFIGFAFLGTSALLMGADLLSRKSLYPAEGLGWGKALLVGIAQGIAIMPGISRSGATMAAGLALGLNREQAARFSFLLSGPIILLAAGKQSVDAMLGGETGPGVAATLFGCTAAAITGYLAIAGLMAYLRKHSFKPFAIYTALLGTGVIVWQLMAS
ncbi:MAG: undecaprenyl-diphosphate phosphatase [Clostridiales bacterium]|nr:undecaprenyl-diphosphate phosphatase [Clostridiales bacterium]